MFIFPVCASEETNYFSDGWFPVSRIFYLRYMRKGNARKGACKRKSWSAHHLKCIIFLSKTTSY